MKVWFLSLKHEVMINISMYESIKLTWESCCLSSLGNSFFRAAGERQIEHLEKVENIFSGLHIDSNPHQSSPIAVLRLP